MLLKSLNILYCSTTQKKMSLHKSCRLQIQSLTIRSIASQLISPTSLLLIRDVKGTKLKELPVGDCVQARLDIDVDVQAKLEIGFQLVEGAGRVYGVGVLREELYLIGVDQICQLNCSIIHSQLHHQLAILKLHLSFDDEKVTYALPQDSITEEQPPPSPPPKTNGKITRKRRHTYLMRKQNARLKINNKIISSANIVLGDFRVQLEEGQGQGQGQGVEGIRLVELGGQFVGEIVGIGGLGVGELAGCQVRVPADVGGLLVEIRMVDGCTYYSRVQFDILPDEGVKNVRLKVQNGDKVHQGSLWLSYRPATQQQQSNNQRQQMNNDLIQKEQSLLHPNIMRYLHSPTAGKKPPQSTLRSKLRMQVQANSNITLVSRTVEQKILPFRRPREMESLDISRAAKGNPYHGLYYQSDDQQRQKRTLDDPYKSIRHPNAFQFRHLESNERKNDIHSVKISSVMVNLYSSFMMKYGIHIARDEFIGKFLQIYSSRAQIFRSDAIFASQNLSWKLVNCNIDMKPRQNLTIEVCITGQNTLLGQSVISLYILQQSLDQFNFHRGHLIYNGEQIGKLTLNYTIGIRARMKTIQRERQTEMEREKINGITDRLKLGLPHRKSMMLQRSPDRDEREFHSLPRLESPHRLMDKYGPLEQIKELRTKKKKKKVFVYRQ